MSNEGNAASYILSSEANVYTVTANVSKLNGDIAKYVPSNVFEALIKKFKRGKSPILV